MPRVYLTTEQRRGEALRKLIRRYQGRDYSDAECAEMIGVHVNTFRFRMSARPNGRCCGAGALSVNELMELQRGLGIPARELAETIFGEGCL